MLAYAYDIVGMGVTRQGVVQTTEKLLKASMSIALCINKVNDDVMKQFEHKWTFGRQYEIWSSGQL